MKRIWILLCIFLAIFSLGQISFATSLENHFDMKWWNDVSTTDESKTYLMVDTYHEGRTLASVVYPDLGTIVFILDEEGEELPIGYFYYARPFSDGYAWVGGFHQEPGFIHRQGAFLSDNFGEYELAYNFSEDHVLAFNREGQGVLLNSKGEEVALVEAPLGFGLSEGLFPVFAENYEDVHYINPRGEIAFTFPGMNGSNFYQGYAWITREILGEEGFPTAINIFKVLVNKEGEVVSPEKANGGSLYYAGHDLLIFSHNERLVYTPYYGLYSTEMKELIPVENLALSNPTKDKIWSLTHEGQLAHIGYYEAFGKRVESGSFTMKKVDDPLYTISPHYKITPQGYVYEISQENASPTFVLYDPQGEMLRQENNAIAGLISDENGIFYVYNVDSGITEIFDEKGRTLMKEEMQPLRAIPGYASTIQDLPPMEGDFKELATPLLHHQEGGYGLVFQKQDQSWEYPFTYSSYFFMNHFFLKDGYWGMVDKHGRWFIDPQLDEVPKFNPSQSLVVFKKDNIWGRGAFYEQGPRFRLKPDDDLEGIRPKEGD